MKDAWLEAYWNDQKANERECWADFGEQTAYKWCKQHNANLVQTTKDGFFCTPINANRFAPIFISIEKMVDIFRKEKETKQKYVVRETLVLKPNQYIWGGEVRNYG